MITDREQPWSDTYPNLFPQWFFQKDFFDKYGVRGFYDKRKEKSFNLRDTIFQKNFAIVNNDPMYVSMTIYQTNQESVDVAMTHEKFQNSESKSYLQLLKEKSFQIDVVIKTNTDGERGSVIGINFYDTKPCYAEAHTLFLTCPWYGLRFIPGGLDTPREFSRTAIEQTRFGV